MVFSGEERVGQVVADDFSFGGSHLSSRFSRMAMLERWQISSMRLWDQTSEIGCLPDFMPSMKLAVKTGTQHVVEVWVKAAHSAGSANAIQKSTGASDADASSGGNVSKSRGRLTIENAVARNIPAISSSDLCNVWY